MPCRRAANSVAKLATVYSHAFEHIGYMRALCAVLQAAPRPAPQQTLWQHCSQTWQRAGGHASSECDTCFRSIMEWSMTLSHVPWSRLAELSSAPEIVTGSRMVDGSWTRRCSTDTGSVVRAAGTASASCLRRRSARRRPRRWRRRRNPWRRPGSRVPQHPACRSRAPMQVSAAVAETRAHPHWQGQKLLLRVC